MSAARSSNNPISYDEQLESLVINGIGGFIYRGVPTKWENLNPHQRLDGIRSLNAAVFSPAAVNFLAYVERRAESQTRGIPYLLEDQVAEAVALCALFPEGSHEITSNWMNQPISARYEFLMKLRDIRHTAIVDFIIAHYRRIMTRNLLARQAEEAEIAERARVAAANAETQRRRRNEIQQAEAGWASLYRRPNLWGGSKGSNKRRGGTRRSTHYKKRRTHRKRHTQRKY